MAQAFNSIDKFHYISSLHGKRLPPFKSLGALNSTLRRNPDAKTARFFGLAIGFVIIAGGYAGGKLGCKPTMRFKLGCWGFSRVELRKPGFR